MEKQAKILFIQGEADFSESLEDVLSNSYHVSIVQQAELAIKLARAQRPDLVLADVDIADQNWFQSIETIRCNEATRHIPIIVISSPIREELRVLAYRKGIDDLVVRPFTLKELLARLTSKLRRVAEGRGISRVLVSGSLQLDLEKLEVSESGRLIPLSVLEFNLLRYFVENQGKVLSRHRILEAVWRDSVVSDRTVDTHIACLRRKLKLYDHLLVTVYGAGYTLKPKEHAQSPSSNYMRASYLPPSI